jgi:membrane-associated phospholipid phosphatase
MTVGPRGLLVGAALSAAGFFGVYALAYEWHTGGQLDGRALVGFSVIRVSLATHAAHFFQSLCDPAPYLLICVVVAAIVLATRGVLLTGAFVAVVAASNASTKALKPLIASASGVHEGPLSTVGVGSFPSGHSTASMALACGIVIVASPALRSLGVIAGGLFVLAVSWSEVLLSAHLPSDVMGGYLVGTFWALLVLAALSATPARLRAGGRRIGQGLAVRVPSLATATATIVIVGATADILAIIRLRPAATRASSLIDFGLVAVTMTLLLAATIATVAALTDAARLEPALPGDRFGDR